MNILFITPTYKPAYIYGGPTVTVSTLAESLVKSGQTVTVYTTTANGKDELDVKINEEVIVNGVKVYYFRRLTKDHSHMSPGFWKKIFLNVKKFDVVHLHSWWNLAIIITAGICKLKGVKPIISPHGMFCNYVIVERNKQVKQAIHSTIGKSLLRNTFLHVATNMEWKESQTAMSGEWSGIVIPNLVELSLLQPIPKKSGTKPFIIGFISRIDPKKGLDLLIKALSRVEFNYRLQIAGTGNEEYVESLKQLALDCGNSDKIDWVGWKNTTEKFAFFASIDLFALTSHDENFAAVVIESLSVGTPVFLSNRVGLSEYVKQKQLGWVTEIDDVDNISIELERTFKDKEKQMVISQSAPDIIRNDYDKGLLTAKYVNYYQELICNEQ